MYDTVTHLIFFWKCWESTGVIAEHPALQVIRLKHVVHKQTTEVSLFFEHCKCFFGGLSYDLPACDTCIQLEALKERFLKRVHIVKSCIMSRVDLKPFINWSEDSNVLHLITKSLNILCTVLVQFTSVAVGLQLTTSSLLSLLIICVSVSRILGLQKPSQRIWNKKQPRWDQSVNI